MLSILNALKVDKLRSPAKMAMTATTASAASSVPVSALRRREMVQSDILRGSVPVTRLVYTRISRQSVKGRATDGQFWKFRLSLS